MARKGFASVREHAEATQSQQKKNPLSFTDCANRIAGAPFSSCTLKIAGGCDAKNAVGTLTSRQTSRAHRRGAHSRATSRRTKTNSVATALLLRRATGERDDCIGKASRRASRGVRWLALNEFNQVQYCLPVCHPIDHPFSPLYLHVVVKYDELFGGPQKNRNHAVMGRFLAIHVPIAYHSAEQSYERETKRTREKDRLSGWAYFALPSLLRIFWLFFLSL